MKLYHGTNTNALDGIAKAGYRLLSRREMFKRKIPLFSGEIYLQLPFYQSRDNNPDVTTLSTNVIMASTYAKAFFSYFKLRNYYHEQVQMPLKRINAPEGKKEIIEFNKNYSLFALKKIQLRNKKRRLDLLKAQPLLFELDFDPETLGKFKKFNSEFEFKDSINIGLSLTGIYTSEEGMRKADKFFKQLNKNLGNLIFPNKYIFPSYFMKRIDFFFCINPLFY